MVEAAQRSFCKTGGTWIEMQDQATEDNDAPNGEPKRNIVRE